MKQTTLVFAIFFAYSLADTCFFSGKEAAKSKYQLNFCEHYNSKSCCLPGHDADISDEFDTLVSVGQYCPYSGRGQVKELRQWWCMGCDPNQPNYFHPDNDTIILVCKEFADKLWGDGTKYDDCGLRLVNRDCGSGFDACGDDVVVPSVAYADANEFVNGIKPAFLWDGFIFQIVTEEELKALQAQKEGLMCFSSATSMVVSVATIVLSFLFM